MNAENKLYPIKFKPIFKPYIWGGTKLKTMFGKNIPDNFAAESWEVSAVQGNLSKVADGFLKGNNIQELIEVYMGDLVGDKVYDRFGLEFPLLIKFIDANQDLSIQVHPDDETARVRHNAFGKTEMWYIIASEEGASLISGFKHKTSKEEYQQYLGENRLVDLLNAEKVHPGDVFFIPAGRIHGIGRGIVLTEIQQTSDITYRIYDWGRVDAQGKSRPLHTALALDVINYQDVGPTKTSYQTQDNKAVKLVQCPYFVTQRIDADRMIERDYNSLDSFVIYICTAGEFQIHYEGGIPVPLKMGETVLIPAEMKQITLVPLKKSTLLEVFLP